MEGLYRLKVWRTNNSQKENNAQISNTLVGAEDDDDEYDDDDSFFELEFTAPDLDPINKKIYTNNGNRNNDNPRSETHEGDKGFDSNQQPLQNSAIKAEVPSQTLSVSPAETISKRKVLPIEPITKPQSSISLLKSAPKLRVFMFKNSKLASHQTEKRTERTTRHRSKLFSIKFKFEESPNHSTFTTSSTSYRQNSVKDDSFSDSSSRSFSKDVIQRYLKLIKPLYVKVSKRNGDNMKSSGQSSLTSSPACSPATGIVCSPKHGNVASGFRTVSKHFGKSKSASAASPPNRRDDSLLLQHDGIQGAILHCKRSFNSTRDSSLLSRFTSDPLPGGSLDWPRKSNEEN